MRIPLIRLGRDESSIAWWEVLFVPLLFPLLVVLFAAMAVLSIVWLLFAGVVVWCRERAFIRQMRREGRYVDCVDIEARMGAGTLIVEQAQNDGVRFWWTSEDVLREAPELPPREEELDYLRCRRPCVFVQWCFDRYLSPVAGRAQLTELPAELFLDVIKSPFIRMESLRQRLPGVRVVATVKRN